MQLVQILLPLYNNQRQAFPKTAFDDVREELTRQFGGVTAFVRSPALGAWDNGAGAVCYDDMVLFEVMVERADRVWWAEYRSRLERQFSQQSILIRATRVEQL